MHLYTDSINTTFPDQNFFILSNIHHLFQPKQHLYAFVNRSFCILCLTPQFMSSKATQPDFPTLFKMKMPQRSHASRILVSYLPSLLVGSCASITDQSGRCMKSYVKWFSHESAERQTDGQTNRQTGPILLPPPLTREIKKNYCFSVPYVPRDCNVKHS